MKKHLDATSIVNELSGQSVFFPKKPAEAQTTEEQPPLTPQGDTVIPRHHEPMIPTTHDTMIPKGEDEVIEAVRKAVKHIGKEGATQRLTLEEKQALADIEYSYKRQGMRTSGNEIIRIALNCAVEDYRKP